MSFSLGFPGRGAIAVGLILGGVFAVSDAAAASRMGIVQKVVDGDTARIAIEGRTRTVHLSGVRSLGVGVCRGRIARTVLTRLLKVGRTVRVRVNAPEFPSGTTIRAEIYTGRRDGFRTINRAQTLFGATWARTDASGRSRFHSHYAAAELLSRKQARGIWGKRCPGAPPNVGVGRNSVGIAPSQAVPWPWEPAAPDLTQPAGVGLTLAAEGLARPVYVTGRPGASGLVVVEQLGLVRVVRNGAPLPVPLLDLTAVVNQAGDERGLLGLAFHPSHAANGLFYVNYVDAADNTQIVEYYVPPGSDVATPESARTLLTLKQPETNHNGGHLAFGRDRMLYVALGDGGDGVNGQNLGNLFGTILRIDVAGSPYRVPPDNPFVATPGAQPEIWAFGLRNPWRFSFDRSGDAMWIGDVGDRRREEINVRAAGAGGANFGWKAFEGTLPSTDLLAPHPHVPPVAEYATGANCSVTGGYVYRGAAVPGLHGKYVYSDYCSGKFWTLDSANPAAPPVEITGSLGQSIRFVTSFGEDLSGELYVIGAAGKIYRFVAKPLV